MDGDIIEVTEKCTARVIMRVQRTDSRLYKIHLTTVEPVCLMANTSDSSWLWHGRLGHINFQSIRMLVEKEMARGVPLIDHPDQVCHSCLAAKQTRMPYPQHSKWRADEPLDLVHVDLCGPITPETVGGNKYFMLLVDDCTRWMSVYILKSKDQTCSTFVKFKAEAENSLGYRIKVVRSDRGGEFLSGALKDVCESAGIKRQFTAPYSPQQNGVVERRNRTVMEMARSLLKCMNVPGCFWGEAVNHSVYLLNRLPTKPMGYRTPFEGWHGKRPQLGHLKVFGCRANVRPAKPHLKKLEDRSVAMVYFGVEQGSKAHRLFDPQSRRIVVSRDVVFEESIAWQWESDFGGKTDFVVEHNEEGLCQSWTGGHLDTDDCDNQPVHDGGTCAEAFGDFSHSGGNIPSGEQGGDPMVDSVYNQTTEGNPQDSGSGNHFHDGMDAEDTVDTEDGPVRFRSLSDVYQNTVEVELTSDTEIEALLAVMDEPNCYAEAAGDVNWVGAMESEIQSINKNKTWNLVKLPVGHKPIGLKWVYKVKRNAKGEIVKYKARLVAKGYVQKKGVDYEEVFAPVAKLDTVRLILALAANRGWEVHHLDVKTAFLNGELIEDVYVSQPEGFVKKGDEQMVLKLSKALYGLKQAPRAWNVKLDGSLKKLGFKKCSSEPAVYTRGVGLSTIILGVYVDDLIVTGGDPEEIAAFKMQMTSEFEMSDLGKLSYYLGIEVEQNEDYIAIKQAGYAKKVLEQFGMSECNATKYPMDPNARLDADKQGERIDATKYRRVIGCLRYLLHTRPDLSFSIGMASRFMEKPTVKHLNAVKQILRYLKGTMNFGLVYTQEKRTETLVGYTDSDVGGDIVSRRSTGGMAFYLNGGLVSWSSYKEKTVALSSCEAEFMAATAAAKQAMWLRNLLGQITGAEPKAVNLFVDNNSAIALMKNPVFHGRSKHIDIKYHFIRECVERGQIAVKKVNTLEQKADALTKPMSAIKLSVMRHLLGVRELEEHQA
jgi:hypothetical protein